MAIESELKFTVTDPSLFQSILSLGTIAGFTVCDRGITPIKDICFDTPDLLFYNGKTVFRLREKGGMRMLTFKAHREATGAAYERIEIESDTDLTADDITAGNLPDVSAVHALREYVGDVNMKPYLTTENNRHILLLMNGDSAEYELALDDVTFTGPKGIATVYELEVESLIGTENDLERIGAWLTDRYPLKKAGPSKFCLGMELVGDIGGGACTV